MSTTVATIAGLQETLVSDSTALFRLQSTLIGAVYNQVAQEANTVQFSTRSAPSAIASAHVENASVDVTTITIDAVNATMQEWPIRVQASKLSLAAPGGYLKVAEAIAGDLAATVDTEIALLCSGFSNTSASATGVSGLTVSNFFATAAELDNTKFIGDKVCILNPISWAKIGEELLSLESGAESRAASFMGTGHVANIAGVQIFVSPYVQNDSTNNYYLGGMFIKQALAFGYRNPLIAIDSGFNLEKISIDSLGVATFVCKEITGGAGLRFLDKSN